MKIKKYLKEEYYNKFGYFMFIHKGKNIRINKGVNYNRKKKHFYYLLKDKEDKKMYYYYWTIKEYIDNKRDCLFGEVEF